MLTNTFIIATIVLSLMSNPSGCGQSGNVLREESPSFIGQGAGEIPAEAILGKVQQKVNYSWQLTDDS